MYKSKRMLPQQAQSIDEYLSSHGLYRKFIAKDGSCLFRAVAEQVFNTQSLHQDVRRQCVAFLRRNRDKFESFVEGSFEERLHLLSNTKEWAGEIEINALSIMYSRDFIIYQEPGCPPANVTEHGFRDKVLLCFSNGNHYDSVYSRKFPAVAGICQAVLYELLYEHVFDVKRETLRAAVELYRSRKNNDNSSEEAILESYGSGDIESIPFSVMKSLDPFVYRNVEFEVWVASKKEQLETDFTLSTGLHFTEGDQCLVRLEERGERYYPACITEVFSESGPVNVYIEELKGSKCVALKNLKPLSWNPSVPYWSSVPDADHDGSSWLKNKRRDGSRGRDRDSGTRGLPTLPPRMQQLKPPSTRSGMPTQMGFAPQEYGMHEFGSPGHGRTVQPSPGGMPYGRIRPLPCSDPWFRSPVDETLVPEDAAFPALKSSHSFTSTRAVCQPNGSLAPLDAKLDLGHNGDLALMAALQLESSGAGGRTSSHAFPIPTAANARPHGHNATFLLTSMLHNLSPQVTVASMVASPVSVQQGPLESDGSILQVSQPLGQLPISRPKPSGSNGATCGVAGQAGASAAKTSQALQVPISTLLTQNASTDVLGDLSSGLPADVAFSMAPSRTSSLAVGAPLQSPERRTAPGTDPSSGRTEPGVVPFSGAAPLGCIGVLSPSLVGEVGPLAGGDVCGLVDGSKSAGLESGFKTVPKEDVLAMQSSPFPYGSFPLDPLSLYSKDADGRDLPKDQKLVRFFFNYGIRAFSQSRWAASVYQPVPCWPALYPSGLFGVDPALQTSRYFSPDRGAWSVQSQPSPGFDSRQVDGGNDRWAWAAGSVGDNQWPMSREGLCSDSMAQGLVGAGRTTMENGGGCLGSETGSQHVDQWFRGAPQGYGDPAGGYAESGERGKMLGFPGALGPFEASRTFPMWGGTQERGQQPK
uniref:UDP-N-acetylglucosamine transferase subunit ALG13-like isoform X1 n=1 Tax=Myxine glutinosa TaxID=7769 RepID=UPI00358E20EE